MMFQNFTVEVTFDAPADFNCSFESDSFEVQFEGAPSHSEYQGPYSATPSEEVQTLSTANTILVQNITIDPIPSNYGLITWDGTTITVS